MFDQMIPGYPRERIFTVVLMLRVWVMYGKSKKIGLVLGATFAIALLTSLIVFSKQPPVSQIVQHTTCIHGDTPLDSHWSGTALYVLSPLLTQHSTHG